MEAEQDQLSREFESFVEFFFVANTDYHIGVTTTDMEDAGERGRLFGDTPVITRETPDPAAVFRENVRVGTNGSGFEQGFEAARTSLSPAGRGDPADLVDDTLDLLEGLADAGIQHAIVNLPNAEELGVLEIFGEEIIPKAAEF